MPEQLTITEFEKLFRQHHIKLCDIAYNIVGSKDIAKDIVQEAFFKLWTNKDNIQVSEQIGGYLFKATAHLSLNHIRNKRKEVRMDIDVAINSFSSSPTRHEVTFTELEHLARKAIDNLPPRCKAIYLLSRHEELTYAEIANSLDISVKTVENQMSIALEKLRAALKPFLVKEMFLLLIVNSIFQWPWG